MPWFAMTRDGKRPMPDLSGFDLDEIAAALADQAVALPSTGPETNRPPALIAVRTASRRRPSAVGGAPFVSPNTPPTATIVVRMIDNHVARSNEASCCSAVIRLPRNVTTPCIDRLCCPLDVLHRSPPQTSTVAPRWDSSMQWPIEGVRALVVLPAISAVFVRAAHRSTVRTRPGCANAVSSRQHAHRGGSSSVVVPCGHRWSGCCSMVLPTLFGHTGW